MYLWRNNFLAKVFNFHILKIFHLKETKYRSEKKGEKSLYVQKKGLMEGGNR